MKEVAVAIIRRNSKILACQRRRNIAYPLKWEFPGGKIEEGESPSKALRRELLEELGIKALIGGEFHRQEWVYPEADPYKDGSFRVFYFMVDRFAGEPVNKAFEQMRWVTADELRRLDILEGNRAAIDLLLHSERHGTFP